MKLLQTVFREQRRRSVLLQSIISRRHFAAKAAEAEQPSEESLKRNYAKNNCEYNCVITSLIADRRHYLVRDAYDDMMLDGVKPERDTFRSLITSTMLGARLQDALYFRDQMRSMGLLPDVSLYNYLISTCAKCDKSDQATLIFEEMKQFGVKPTGQTFICLLSAYATAGRLERVYAIVRDMTAAGLGLNKFCYAALISAHSNKIPLADDTAVKIIELVNQSKGWSSVEHTKENAQNVLIGVSEEELYNLPTAEYLHRRVGFLNRALTVYHVAFKALADLKNVEVTEALLKILRTKEECQPDFFIALQIMRCYLHSGDLDRGFDAFVECMKVGPGIEAYVTLIEGAMIGYTPRGMQLAEEKLKEMIDRNFFLSPKMGSDLLIIASGEQTGGFTVANMIWDTMQNRNRSALSLPAVEAYHRGLKDRKIPDDDPRLFLVSKTLDDLRKKTGSLSNWANVTQKASSVQ